MLLNLISNGFYATMKRKEQGERRCLRADPSRGDQEPRRQRRDQDSRQRHRHSPEVKDKMFNPFFTTKPAGEGTGLGLSLSHDIIVKQHAGTIEVDTQPGVHRVQDRSAARGGVARERGGEG